MERPDKIRDVSANVSHQWLPIVAQLALGSFNTLDSGPEQLDDSPAGWFQENDHWMIFSMLQQRQLNRLMRDSLKPGFDENAAGCMSKIGLFDGLAAWRLARQLKSRKRD